MITQDQEKYLMTIPEDKIVHIQPYAENVGSTALSIIDEINKAISDLQVVFIGAAALGIAGQNDIDLHILSHPDEYDNHLPALVKMFGQPDHQSPRLVKWEFVRNGFDVELYLTDKNSLALKEQIKIFEILRDDSRLREEYESLKKELDGVSFRQYMRAKYEFFNKILGV